MLDLEDINKTQNIYIFILSYKTLHVCSVISVLPLFLGETVLDNIDI